MLNQLLGILAGGITALVACALALLFLTRERTELFLRNTFYGSKSVFITAVNGILRIASDLVLQLVLLLLIMVALARVLGYVFFFFLVWDITLEHFLSNVILLHIMNANNTFFIIINLFVDCGCWLDELQRFFAENNIIITLHCGGYCTLTFCAAFLVYAIDHKLQKKVC